MAKQDPKKQPSNDERSLTPFRNDSLTPFHAAPPAQEPQSATRDEAPTADAAPTPHWAASLAPHRAAPTADGPATIDQPPTTDAPTADGPATVDHAPSTQDEAFPATGAFTPQLVGVPTPPVVDGDPFATADFVPGAAPKFEEPKVAGAAEVAGYDIVGVLGKGGMGVVYKARQKGLKRLVALKMIRDAAMAGPEDLARFQIEAEALATLQHPNIVQIYEVGECDKLPYFSLEYVEGGNLGKTMGASRSRRAGRPRCWKP